MQLPSVITSDQGEFHNRVNQEIMQDIRIDHRLTTPYHPQDNGLDECAGACFIVGVSV